MLNNDNEKLPRDLNTLVKELDDHFHQAKFTIPQKFIIGMLTLVSSIGLGFNVDNCQAGATPVAKCWLNDKSWIEFLKIWIPFNYFACNIPIQKTSAEKVFQYFRSTFTQPDQGKITRFFVGFIPAAFASVAVFMQAKKATADDPEALQYLLRFLAPFKFLQLMRSMAALQEIFVNSISRDSFIQATKIQSLAYHFLTKADEKNLLNLTDAEKRWLAKGGTNPVTTHPMYWGGLFLMACFIVSPYTLYAYFDEVLDAFEEETNSRLLGLPFAICAFTAMVGLFANAWNLAVTQIITVIYAMLATIFAPGSELQRQNRPGITTSLWIFLLGVTVVMLSVVSAADYVFQEKNSDKDFSDATCSEFAYSYGTAAMTSFPLNMTDFLKMGIVPILAKQTSRLLTLISSGISAATSEDYFSLSDDDPSLSEAKRKFLTFVTDPSVLSKCIAAPSQQEDVILEGENIIQPPGFMFFMRSKRGQTPIELKLNLTKEGQDLIELAEKLGDTSSIESLSSTLSSESGMSMPNMPGF